MQLSGSSSETGCLIIPWRLQPALECTRESRRFVPHSLLLESRLVLARPPSWGGGCVCVWGCVWGVGVWLCVCGGVLVFVLCVCVLLCCVFFLCVGVPEACEVERALPSLKWLTFM